MQDLHIILDADGVFMNEMTYWRTALVVALDCAALPVTEPATWSALDRACLQAACLQRITKSRGCNSNWDLAAVMAAVLTDDAQRPAARAELAAEDFAAFAHRLAKTMEARWHTPPAGAHPLAGFGIDRESDWFLGIRDRFQDVHYRRRTVHWEYPRNELIPPAGQTRAALADLTRAASLTVCTSRHRDEMQRAIDEFALAEYFDLARMVTYDEALRAQQETERTALGKPHWFPLAAAALGYADAVAALRDPQARLTPVNGARYAYVGDTSADFDAARGCHQRGLPIAYIHVDSGITRAETLAEITAHPVTCGRVPHLSAAVQLLKGQA
jgi:phosphoglycolate phosphatase-like HAD superfamily hydrolase